MVSLSVQTTIVLLLLLLVLEPVCQAIETKNDKDWNEIGKVSADLRDKEAGKKVDFLTEIKLVETKIHIKSTQDKDMGIVTTVDF